MILFLHKLRGRVLGFIIWIIYRLLSLTWRIKIIEPLAMTSEIDEKKGLILAHFHGDELVLISLAKKYRISTMTSTSKDGEIMNTALHLLGAKTSRGSATRGGVSALKGLLRLNKDGYNASFAVDGPKGPLHKVKPGVFEFSRLTHANIYAAGVSVSTAWHFPKSWNKTYLPKPFSEIQVVWTGPLLAIEKGIDPRSEELAKTLENQLFDARSQASKLIADHTSQN